MVVCTYINENEYEGLEDVDEFGGTGQCDICGKPNEDGNNLECCACFQDDEIPDHLIPQICRGCIEPGYPWAQGWWIDHATGTYLCPEHATRENIYSGKWSNVELESSEYEGLEDVDEFEQSHYDPIYDEFTYQYLGPYEGHEITFRGDRYICKGGIVYKDGQEFAKYRDEVPWDDESFIWNGPIDSPDVKFSWRELIDELTHIYGYHDDHGDPPPGIPVYESEYDDLEDVDEFEEENDYHPFLNQLEIRVTGRSLSLNSLPTLQITGPDRIYYVIDDQVYDGENHPNKPIATLTDKVPWPELSDTVHTTRGFREERWTWEELIYTYFDDPNSNPDEYYGLTESEYDDLEDVDQFQELDNGIWIQITSLKPEERPPLTEDDLINGAREVLARHGYEVGDFQADGHHGDNPLWISGYMELPNYAAWRPREFNGYDVEIYIPAREHMAESSEYDDLEDVDKI